MTVQEAERCYIFIKAIFDKLHQEGKFYQAKRFLKGIVSSVFDG